MWSLHRLRPYLSCMPLTTSSSSSLCASSATPLSSSPLSALAMAFEGPEELPHSFVGVSELSTERGWGLPPALSSQLLLRPSFGFSSSSPAQKPSPHLYSVLPSCHLRTALHCCPQLAQGVVEVAWLSSAEPTNATDSSIDIVSPSCCFLCPH